MTNSRLTLVLPPLSQLNTPYPSTAYLSRAMKSSGVHCEQRDLGIALMLKVFSKTGLSTIFDALEQREHLPEPAWHILALRHQHETVIDPVIRFLQGRDRTLAHRILNTPFIPRGPRVDRVDLDAFGSMSVDDAARRLCTLYIEDLTDLITATIDEGFRLSQYSHHLCTGPVRFEPIAERLQETTPIDAMLDELIDAMVNDTQPDVVGLSVAFPGMLIPALRIGVNLRKRGIKVVMGGGYVNTELREVDVAELWDCVDALTYDDGEGPLMALMKFWGGGPDERHRTRTVEGLIEKKAPVQTFVPIGDYTDLPLDQYLQLVDGQNPAHRLWSDGRWNKMTLAHGCYWKKCAFCDINLDYISNFEPARIGELLDGVQELIASTGHSGFHMVDEAAPPRAMRDFAIGLLARGVSISWWGNIRFEPSFTPDLCRLLAASGLIAVTGGLEVASERLLALMEKGITIENAARSAAAFTDAGVMVHAYLMYGFPTQTEQETVNAMEVVRQMFQEGVLSSAFWHRFVLTRHSRVYQEPERYGVSIPPMPTGPLFATNDIPHIDTVGADPDRFDEGLVAALHSWMEHDDIEQPVHMWFEPHLIPSDEHPRRIANALRTLPDDGKRLLWIGGDPLESPEGLSLNSTEGVHVIGGRPAERQWLWEVIEATRPTEEPVYLHDVVESFPGDWNRYEDRWRAIRNAGMLLI